MLRIVREAGTSDPGSGGRPRTEAMLLVQILPCLFCSRGKCLGAEIMLLCGLSQAGPSTGLEQLRCQTLTRLVRGRVMGQFPVCRAPHCCSAWAPGRGFEIRGPVPPQGTARRRGGGGEARYCYHPIPLPGTSLPQALSSIIFLSSPSSGLCFLGTQSLPPATYCGAGAVEAGRAPTWREG